MGLGWFGMTEKEFIEHAKFSSPSGVGSQWVHGARTTKKFSSPSGDRLVPIEDVHAYNEIEIFVPAWGWVGSGVRFSSLG